MIARSTARRTARRARKSGRSTPHALTGPSRPEKKSRRVSPAPPLRPSVGVDGPIGPPAQGLGGGMRQRIRTGIAVTAGATLAIGLLASIASAGANVAIADG